MRHRFSDRTALPRRCHPFARALAEARAAGRPLLDLTSSNPTRVGLLPARMASMPCPSPDTMCYEPAPFGLAVAREWLGHELGAEPSSLVLGAGTSELYGWLFTLLCDPGDEVLVPTPSYPLLEHLARFASVRLRPYRIQWAEGWFEDLDTLRAAVGPRSRAILLVRPNNPTGSYPREALWELLAQLGLPVICDEVFLSYPHSGRLGVRRSAAELAEEAGIPLLFALDGLSKRCGMPQFKLSWMRLAGTERKALLEARSRLELLADAHLSLSTPVQLALPTLLRAGASVRHAIQKRLRTNLEVLRHVAVGAPFDALLPEGGWYSMLRLPASRDEESWMLHALSAGLVLQPGWFYDADPAMGPLAVLSLLTPAAEFGVGLERLRDLCARD